MQNIAVTLSACVRYSL